MDTPPTKPRAYRELGAFWQGYQCVRNEKGDIVGAVCLDCTKKYTKHSQRFLLNHKATCKERVEPIGESQDTENASPQANKRRRSDGQSEAALVEISPNSQQRGHESNNCGPGSNNFKHLNELLAKLLVRFRIDPQEASSVHIKNIFKEINPDYEIPSSNQVIGQVCRDAVQNIIRTNLQRRLTQVMYIQKDDLACGNISLLSVVIDEQKKYIPIDFRTFEIVTQEVFQQFCENSIETFQESYKVCISFIVTNTTYECDPISYSEGQRFIFFIRSHDQLITKLENVKFEVDKTSIADADRFLASVANLKDNLRNITVSQATNILLGLQSTKAYDDDEESVGEIIGGFLSSIHVASTYLNPLYRDKFITSSQQRDLFQFISIILDSEEGMACLAQYRNKTSHFESLFDTLEQIDPRRFWLTAIPFYERLGRFALNLISVPACPKKIEIAKIVNRCDTSHFNDTKLSLFHLSVIFEDLSL
ncbi:hypothetical protein QAD02_000002 [Eretmocerus hayati]|uniref:Uncharacterized protein n=1 Tax=Eretmocerus hayati TaxID=131215 RepID=A0ACC2NCQ9_9HYME|nr:hypothetical protein QAD02_000002 [Eretmocerus hayati]